MYPNHVDQELLLLMNALAYVKLIKLLHSGVIGSCGVGFIPPSYISIINYTTGSENFETSRLTSSEDIIRQPIVRK